MNDQTAIAAAAGAEDRLSSEDMRKVLDVLKGSNSVELKLVVTDGEGPALRHLGFDPVEAEPRQTYFFDTPDLRLNKAGLIVRARRSRGDKGDTVVKLRPVDPAMLDEEFRLDPTRKIEVDVMPGGFVCSASAKGKCSGQEVYDACEGIIPLKQLLSPAQRAFFANHVPDGLKLKDLVPLGPTFLLRVKYRPKNFDRPIVVELWLYPDGSRLLEISTKGTPDEAFQLGAEFKAFLLDGGFTIRRGISKTASALDFFSKHRTPLPAA